jgi:thiamine biosynthesis lipoprotein ApbE
LIPFPIHARQGVTSAHGRFELHRFAFNAMGCPCALQVEADAVSAQRAAAAVKAEVDRLDRKYSHYRDDSLVAMIGAGADAGDSIVLDNESADLLDFSATLHAQSGGRRRSRRGRSRRSSPGRRCAARFARSRCPGRAVP